MTLIFFGENLVKTIVVAYPDTGIGSHVHETYDTSTDGSYSKMVKGTNGRKQH